MNISKIVVFLSLAGLGLQSCDKLDLRPTEFIESTKAFRNLEDVNMGVLGAYEAMVTLIEENAIVSDEVMLPTENTVSNTAAHRWLYDSTYGSVTSAFYNFYVVISRANQVLEALPDIALVANGQARFNQYQGELLALRAYSHFELLRAYASSYEGDGMGIPYMKRHEVTYPGRPSVQSNFDDINADLEAAKELISLDFNDNTRITRKGISAIQARVALYEKKWENAITYSTEVIDQEPLAIYNDFGKIWKEESQAEVVWQLARVVGDSRVGAIFYRETGGIVLYAPAFKLINSFGTNEAQRGNDVRYGTYIKYDPNRPAGTTRSAYLVNKYVGNVQGSPGLASIKLFRTGEMYLIKAEAMLENNSSAAGIAAAGEVLKKLRDERINGNITQPYTDKQRLLHAIYEERLKELAFEGHRFFDLKRRNLPVERLAEDAINATGAVKLEPTVAQYCFPIPAEEMLINKAMDQNPYYEDGGN